MADANHDSLIQKVEGTGLPKTRVPRHDLRSLGVKGLHMGFGTAVMCPDRNRTNGLWKVQDLGGEGSKDQPPSKWRRLVLLVWARKIAIGTPKRMASFWLPFETIQHWHSFGYH